MAEAPSEKDLAGAKLNKVKTNEGSGEPTADEMAPFKKLWKDNGGQFSKVKGAAQFKDMKWRHNFEPEDADSFAKGVLKGLAFED